MTSKLISTGYFERKLPTLMGVLGMDRRSMLQMISSGTYGGVERKMLAMLSLIYTDDTCSDMKRAVVDNLIEVWPYVNLPHFYVEPSITEPPYNRDTTILSEFKDGVVFDVLLKDTYYMFDLYRPNMLCDYKKDWYCNVYIKRSGDRRASSPIYRIMFDEKLQLKNCLFTPLVDSNTVRRDKLISSTCTSCKKCTKNVVDNHDRAYSMYTYYSRAYNNDCDFCIENNCVMPHQVTLIITYVLEKYKELMQGGNPTGVEGIYYSVLDEDNGERTLLPLSTYAHFYQSPDSDSTTEDTDIKGVTRKAYFRKSRGRGDYEKQGDEYIYVGKNQGSYSYVSGSTEDSATSLLDLIKGISDE